LQLTLIKIDLVPCPEIVTRRHVVKFH